MPNDRRAVLTAALGFTRLSTDAPELRLLRAWLDSWRGIGALAVGMGRRGDDLQLTRYAEQGWRATLYAAGIAHSVVSGSAWALTPWRAVQGGLGSEGVSLYSQRSPDSWPNASRQRRLMVKLVMVCV